MTFIKEIITGLLCLVIFAALPVITRKGSQNNLFALLAFIIKSLLNFFSLLTSQQNSSTKLINADIYRLVFAIPNFFHKKHKASGFGLSFTRIMPLLFFLLIFSSLVNAASITSTGTGGVWNNPGTWIGGVPGLGDDVTIAAGATVTIDANATLGSLSVSGTLQYDGTSPRTLSVSGIVTVNSGGIFKSAPSGSTSTITTHSLSIGGSLMNNGTIDFSATAGAGGSTLNASGVGIIFTGGASATFNCVSATLTNLRKIDGVILNKGNSSTSVLTFTPGGTFQVLSGNSDGFLEIQNGTFKIIGSNTFSNPVFNVTSYSIPNTGGFELSNPNATVVGQNGSVDNNGDLKISDGTFNIGTASGNSSVTNNNGKFTLSGGVMNIAGRFVLSNATGTFSGGTLNLSTIGHASSTEATFHCSLTSNLNISGNPLITFTSPNSSTFNDIEILSGSGAKSITGGIFRIGTASTPAGSTFKVNSSIPIANFTVNSVNSPSVILVTNDLTVSNQLTLNGGNIDAETNLKKVIVSNNSSGAIAAASGHIVGTLQRSIAGSGTSTYVFPVQNGAFNTPFELTFHNLTSSGTIVVSSKNGDNLGGSLLDASLSVNNYWTVSNTGTAFSTVDGKLSFPAGLKDAGVNTTNLLVGMNDSGWSYPSSSSTASSVSFTGVSSLSNNVWFALAECTPPTITLGTNPVICQGIIAADLGYSGTTGTPDEYRIDFDATAEAAGLVDVTATALPASPISVTVPAGVSANTYNATIYVKNAIDCESSGTNFTITINPKPIGVNTTLPICSGIALNVDLQAIISNGVASNFTWTVVDNPNVTGENNGSGDFIAQTLTNTSSAIQLVVYTVTPSSESNGCDGAPFTVTITVNPDPLVTATPAAQAICSTGTTGIALAGPVAGTTFSWTVSISPLGSITGSAAGSGNVIAQALVNTTSLPATATYTVTPSANGCDGTPIDVVITVNPKPTLSSTLTPPTICSNTTFSYTPTSNTPGTTFSWTRAAILGITPATGSGVNNPNETLVNISGAPINVTYVYSLSANGCTNPQSVVVQVLPTLTLSSSLTSTVCSNNLFSYSATCSVPGVTISWTRALVAGISNAASSGGTNISETLINTTPANVVVPYVFTLTAGSCSNTQTVNLTVKPAPVLSSTLAPTALCNTTNFSYTATSATAGTTFQWNRPAITGISNPPAAAASNLINETLTNTSADPIDVTYEFTLRASGCPNPQNVVVRVYPTPKLSSTLSPTAICSNSLFSYSPTSLTAGATFNWSRAAVAGISNPATSGTNNPNETLINTTTNPINVTYSYTIAANGCPPNVQNVVVVVNPKPIVSVVAASSTICNGSSTTLTASGASTYSWGPDPSLSATTGAVVTVNPTTTTTYTVTGTDANGCSNTSTITITVNPKPNVTVTSSNGTLCNGGSSTLTASGANTYSWSPATGLSATTGAVVTANPSSTTTYTVTGTDGNGCTNTATVTVNVNSVPSITVTPASPTICAGNSVTLTASGASTYVWSPDVDLSATTGATVTASPATTQTYTVTGTDANGCVGTKTVTITVNPKPTLTSPNPPDVCSSHLFTYTPTSPGATITWSRAAVAGITPATASGSGSISEVLYNSNATSTTVIYTFNLTTASGCTNTETINLLVVPAPLVLVTASTGSVCGNSSFNLSSSTTAVPPPLNLINESFVDASNWTLGNNSLNGTPANAGWTIRGDRYNPVGGQIRSPNRNNFILSDSYNQNGTVTSTTLQSKVMDTRRYSTLSLSFWHCYIFNNQTNEAAKVQVSTDNSTWTTVATYTSNQGSRNNFANPTINLNAYINKATLYIRFFYYSSGRAMYWAIDDVTVDGTVVTTISWSSSPVNPTFGNPTTANVNGVTQTQTTTYTASYTYPGFTCPGEASVTVTSNPTPVIPNQTPPAICSGTSFSVSPEDVVPTVATVVPPGTTYSWPAPVVTGGITGGSAQVGKTSISQTLTNPSTIDRTATYTVTPTTGGCSGTPFTVVVTVHPAPTVNNVSFNQGGPYCSGSAANAINSFTSNVVSVPPPTTFEWNSSVDIGFGTSGTGDIPNYVATNLTASPVTTTVSVRAIANGCPGPFRTFNITVNPTPNAKIEPNYCPVAPNVGKIELTATGGTVGSTYLWSTGQTTNPIYVDIAGNYSVTITTGSCSSTAYMDASTELVVNGDFTAGNTGFFSSYTYYPNIAGNSELIPDNGTNGYAVGTNGQNYHPNFWGIDHTRNLTGNKNFMLVNGHGSALTIWQETVTVQPNTDYYFSAWAMSLNAVPPYARLQFEVNGTLVGTVANLGAGPNSTAQANANNYWTRFYSNPKWNSGALSGPITIRIFNLENAAGGNDFALDDISFGTLDPIGVTVNPQVTGGNVAICEIEDLHLLANRTGGKPPYTFSWTGPNGFTSTDENPIITNITSASAGIYTLTATDGYGCGPVSGTTLVTVNLAPACTITGPTSVCPSPTGYPFSGIAGMTSYFWEITAGVGTIIGPDNLQDVQVMAGSDCSASFTLSLTVTNGLGCSQTCSQVLNVVDNIKPTWVDLPGGLDRTVQCSDPVALAAAQALLPVPSDNCSTLPVAKTAGSFVPSAICPSGGTYTNTFTVFDACNNEVAAVYTQVITVIDDTKPTWTTGATTLDRTVECSDAAGLAAAKALFPVASDNCDIDVTDLVKVSGTFVAGGACSQAGTITNTWTVKDNCGNTSDVFTQVITIQDTTVPVWSTLPNALDQTVECGDATALAAAQALVPVATDNCDADLSNVVKVAGSFVAGACPNSGTIVNTFTVKDDCGNTSAVYTQTITIIDTTAPTWVTPGVSLNVYLECDDATGLATAQSQIPVATDNCDVTLVPVKTSGAFVPSVGLCSQAGTYTNTFVVTDDCGNTSAVFTQIITLEDNTAPNITAPPVAVISCLDDYTDLTITGNPMVTDNCDPAPVITHSDNVIATTCAGDYKIVRTWTATDECGNSNSADQDIFIQDILAPVISALPAPSTIDCDETPVFATPTAIDACASSFTLTSSDTTTPGSCPNSYSITRTWIATDCAGNSSPPSSQTINVADTTAPTISCPADANVNCSDATTPAALGFATAIDNCDASPVISYTDAVAATGCAGNYTITRTWRATDECGNSSTCNQTITVTQPDFTAILATTGNAACVSSIVLPVLPVVTDACGVVLTPSGPVVTADPPCAGTKTYTWTYSDCSSHSHNYVHTVTIDAPVVSMPANPAAVHVACAASATVPTPPVVADNCGRNLSVDGGVASADPACSGDKTWTFTYTDCANATYTWVYTYTIDAPVVSMPANPAAVHVACAASATVPTPPVVADNCGRNLSVDGGVASADPACSGDKTWTFTYTDCANATYTWVYTYTIDAPVVSMPANPAAVHVACAASATVPTPPVVADNCGRNLSVDGGVASADPACSGDKTWTFTYTDCANATYTWVYTYTIDAPVVSMPANPAAVHVACAASATVPTPPVVADNCGRNLSVDGGVASADPACSGDKTWTFTYTDCANATYTWVYTYTIDAPVVSMPANPAAVHVACAASATVPTPPVVADNCGRNLSVDGGVASADPACSGDKTWTFTYTDCANATYTWVYTYTIDAPVVSMPANPAAVHVACAASATVPTPPVVADNCGRNLSVDGGVASADPACSGDKTWTFTYTDCANATYTWVYTYTIDAPVVSMPANPAAVHVACAASATVPTPPVVADNCGRNLSVDGGVASADPACSGDKTWTFTYTDCANATYTWVYTYTIDAPVVSMPANPAAVHVACAASATVPTPPVVADNCGRNLSVDGGVASADPACSGDKTWTFTYTDCANATYTWVYTYTIDAPVVSMPANPAAVHVACAASATVPTPPVVADNCGRNLSVDGGVASADPACSGDKTWTFTYTDCANATYTWVYTYTIDAPVVSMPANPAAVHVACAASATVPTPPVVADNCGRNLSVDGGVASADPACSGDKTWTFTYTDCANATYTWVYTYTIDAPVVSMPANPAAVHVACAASATVPTPPVVADNCGRNLSVDGGVASADPACSGDKTWTFTYTDCANATYTWVYTYTIDAPVVSMPANPAAVHVACAASATVPTPPVVADNCGRNLSVDGGVASADPACSGDKTWTFTYTDCANATYTWVYTYTIDAPVVSMPANPAAVHVACAASATVPTPPVVADNCGRNLSVDGGVASADPACSGDKTWTFTYTDCANATYTWVYTYTIDAPVVSMPANPAAVHVACAASATVPTPPVVADNCGRNLSVDGGVASADPACSGDKTWTFTYTDCANATYTWVYTYTIDAPVVSMPANPAAVHVACAASATVPTPPVVADNCGRNLSVDGGVASADPACSGDKTWTFTYTDCANATYTWVYTYTIDAPVVSMPANPAAVHVACAASATVPTPPVVADNCGRNLSVDGGVASADPACSGDKTWTFTYTDCANATYTWVYTYTIDAPVVSMPANPAAVHVACAASATVPTPPVVADNCGRNLSVDGGVASADPACSGDKTWTFTYTDCANATYTWVYTYTIDAPVVSMPANPAAVHVACAASATVPTPPVVADNCGRNLSVDGGVASADPACSGDKTWTFTYTDCANATYTWVYTYTIDAPVVSMPANPAAVHVACAASATVPTPPVVADNCGRNLSVDGGVASADPACSGDKTWTFTYTDCANATYTWVYTYTIDAPVVSMPANPAAVHVACAASATVPTPPVVADNCGRNLSVDGGVASADPACSGDKTWTFTYTDCANATYTWVYTYTIDAPVVSMPANPAAVHVACAASATVPTPPVVADNCGRNLSVDGGVASADPACSGDKTWTFTYTDCANATYTWVYTYTIDAPVVSMPANPAAVHVACAASATVPTPPVVADNCGRNLSVDGGVASADPACSGDKTWTFTYTDCANATYTWVYTYTIDAPVVSMPANPAAVHVACAASATVPTPPVVADNCGRNLSVDGGVASADPACSGDKTWTFTYTDCANATYTWVYTYTIDAPVVSMPANPAAVHVACAASATVPTPPVVADNCGRNLSVDGGVASADPACSGDKTWTFTYTDCANATYTWVYTYTIDAPVVSMPANPAAVHVACAASATVPTPPVVADNCGRNLSVDGGVASADPACSGDKTWTFTYTDCANATYTWVYTYTIDAPVVSMPANPAAVHVACAASATVPTPPVVADNCGRNLSVDGGVASADPACSGDKTWTFTYTDCANATYTWVYTYTIDAPVVSMPANPAAVHVACAASATVPTPPVVADNCGRNLSVDGGVASADPACSGDKTWTFTYTDCANATYTWVYTYTIDAPVVSMPANPAAVHVACAASATVPTPPVVADNCGRNLSVDGGVASADPACSGDKTWTFTYTDCANATYTWVYTYTIDAPVVSMPANPAAVHVACAASATVPTPPVVADNCGRNLSVDGGVASADPACSGDKTWTFTYTDCANATYTWVYTYTIDAPVVSMPANPAAVHVACAASATVPTPPVVADNCGRNLSVDGGVASADPACSGDKTWTFTYTDCANATYTWVYTYTIDAPVVSMPANPAAVHVACAASATVPTPPVVADNCGRNLSVDGGVASADPACSGDKTWTFTYTDCANATYTWVYTYTIDAPVVSMPANPAAVHVACAASATVPTPPVVADNCGRNLSVDGGVASADPACSGDKTWTFTYTDCANATYTWVYTYTIDAPVVSMPANPAAVHVACAASATVPTPPVVADNCGRNLSVDGGVASADPACSGDKTWTFTYTDCANATYTWVYTYTIDAPVVSMPANPAAVHVACAASATVPTPPVVADNCGRNLSVDGGVASADPACSGDKTWTFTYTDCANATYTWVYTYTIDAPVVSMPANPAAVHVACAASATVPTPPVVADNCGRNLSVDGGVASADPACSGDKTWTFTYTDCANATYTWVYTYTIDAPVVSMPANPAAVHVACAASATVPTPPVVADNCGRNLSVDGGVASADPACSGDKTWTFTYTDCANATYTWVYTYTIDAPVVSMPANPAAVHVACAASATVPTPPVVADNCGRNLSVDGGVASADPACSGDKTWTFTYTDCANATYTWVYTYTIDANILPVADPLPDLGPFTCYSDIPAPNINDVMGETANCGGVVTVTFVSDSADPGCSGTVVRTYKIEDSCGNSDNITQNIIINKVTAPIIACPSPISPASPVNVNSGVTYIHSGSGWDATATDACSTVTLTATLSGATTTSGHTTLDGVAFNIGVTTITWTAIDACTNNSSCSFDIEVLGLADLKITKNGPATAVVGTPFDYTITVENLGPAPAPVVTINDAVPASYTNPEYSPDGGTTWLSWPGSYVLPNPLAVGGSESILLRGTPDCSAIGSLSNTADVALSPIVDPDLTNNTSTVFTDVSDDIPPSFTLLSTTASYCVNSIISAVYNASPIDPDYDDLTTPRPEYYLFKTGSTVFDLDLTANDFDDNCCAANSLILHWRIDFADTPDQMAPHNPVSHASITGTGQPSTHADIQFPGDGVNFTDVIHQISYWLEDCHGNSSGEQSVNITIKPRPNIIKGN